MIILTELLKITKYLNIYHMLLFKKNGTDRVIFKVTSCLYTRDLHRLTQKMLNILEARNCLLFTILPVPCNIVYI